jgi:hypothetical protein
VRLGIVIVVIVCIVFELTAIANNLLATLLKRCLNELPGRKADICPQMQLLAIFHYPTNVLCANGVAVTVIG